MSQTAAVNEPKWKSVPEMKFEPEVLTKYVYVLTQKNQPREAPVYEIVQGRQYNHNGKNYKDYQNLLFISSIVWDGVKPKPFGWGDTFPPGRRRIRYYAGCETIFMDLQPKDKETIDGLVQSTPQMWFSSGEIEVMGYDKMLKLYCDICSYNLESPYRVPNAAAIFRPINPESDAAQIAANVDDIEKALAWAKEAKFKKMVLHANYLGVPTIDARTNQTLTDGALRALYRKKAMEEPALFLKSYDDSSIELKYWIEKAIETGEISFSLIPNTAAWRNSGKVIRDMSGIKSAGGQVEALVEFAKLGEGEEFAAQLKALFKEE